MKIGSLFSGYRGLDAGVQAVVGGEVAWDCEIDPGASKILAHHWPSTPNHGDITKVDWSQVEPVDVITGGSPCQDVSHAGKRAGMRTGTRSGLWASMCDAIEIIRPALVVWENVRGAYSAGADSGVEPCPLCMGDTGRPALRALGRVLGDLAELGYDARWTGIRAADVGAPHGRFRVFVVAHPSDADDERPRVPITRVSGTTGRERLYRRDISGSLSATTDSAGDGRHEGWTEPARIVGRPDAAECGHGSSADSADLGHERGGDTRRGRSGSADSGDAAADTSGERHGRGQDTGSLGRLDERDAGEARERQRAREVARDRGAEAAADAESERWAGRDEPRPYVVDDGPESAHASAPGGVASLADAISSGSRIGLGHDGSGQVAGTGLDGIAWGPYEPAIRRWERTLGRVAPSPTEPGSKGQPRLSPLFVEWLMGAPEGHVTGVPGLSRNDQLKALGNGCVPQQVAAAVRMLLNLAERAA